MQNTPDRLPHFELVQPGDVATGVLDSDALPRPSGGSRFSAGCFKYLLIAVVSCIVICCVCGVLGVIVNGL